MFSLPIMTYFYTLEHVFFGNQCNSIRIIQGEKTYSAIAASIVANLVLVAYIGVAFQEDAAELKVKKKE